MLTVKDGSKTDWANMPLQDCARGNCLDSYYTLRLFEILEGELGDSRLNDFLNEVIMPLVPEFAKMTQQGIPVSKDKLSKLDEQATRLLEGIKLELLSLEAVKELEDLNINSSKQMKEVLFYKDPLNKEKNDVGLNLVPVSITDKGEYSTDAQGIKFLLKSIEEELGRRE